MENSPLDEFYQNHPLTFIRRDPSEQKLKGSSMPLAKARDLIISKSWNYPDNKESELGILCARCLYVFATGNYNYEDFNFSKASSQLRNLTASMRLSGNSCGFISDVDMLQRCELVKLTNSDLQKSSLHQLMRFCFSHGMYVGHDIDPDEIKSMARWIIRNEEDGVTFTHFSTMMQQAIDLSAFSQYTTQFIPNKRSRMRLNNISEQGLEDSKKMLEEQNSSQHEAGMLLKVATDTTDRKAIADFQTKILHSHIESQLEIEEKIASSHTQDDDVDSVNDS